LAAHEGTHTPAAHCVVPYAFVQAVVHVPQWLMSVVRLISHPFVSTVSQLLKPALHEPILHEPVEQVAVALARLQAVPHTPQFVSVVSGASHPLGSPLSQLPKPGLQALILQAPVEHVPVALARLHGVAQAPQFVSVVSGASQPLASMLSQLPKPGLHVLIMQVAVEHVAIAFARLHAVPQAPQLAREFNCVSQPLSALLSQSANPGLQAIEQMPPPHEGEPLTLEHALAQPPQ
jgi:hypothetical protein